MMDGRFDRHFLVTFAEAQNKAKDGNAVPLVFLMTTVVVAIIVGLGSIMLV